jgi:acetyl esterase/lipase
MSISRTACLCLFCFVSAEASAAVPLTVEGVTASRDADVYNYSKPIEPTLTDIPYAALSPVETLDLYLPANKSGPAPLIIWIHGGAFSVGDKRAMPRRNFGPPPGPQGPYQVQVPDVAALTAKGYAVASINYRLLARPGDRFDEPATAGVQDGKAAVRFLRANAAKYNLDAGKFAVWGNSAGGFMAAMLGVTGDQPTKFDDPALGNANVSSAIQAVIVWFGAIEEDYFDPQIKISHYIPTAKTIPPFLIVNGDADTSVPVLGAQRLNDELLKAGRKSTLRIVSGAGHEDPAFMTGEMRPAFAFIDDVFHE